MFPWRLSGLRTQVVSTRMQVQFLVCSVGYGSGVAVSCGVGCRCGWDLVWLWHRPELQL